MSPQLKDLIDKLLQIDIEKRLGVKGGWDEVKNHEFYLDFNWK
jgi:serum/glucocorticoid-regulated kinase 2